MDTDDTIGGGPVLDRQERPVAVDAEGRPLIPQRVPEEQPTPLQGVFIYLSIIVLVCGVIAIMALELGTPLSSLIVKVPVLIGGTVLIVVSVDALVRVWRSIGAWRRVDAGRARFRLVWAAVLAGTIVVTAAVILVVLVA